MNKVLFRASVSFWRFPFNVLIHHLDRTGFAVKTILGVYLQFPFSFFIRNELIHLGWAEPL